MIRREVFIFLVVGLTSVMVDYIIYSALQWIEWTSVNIAKAIGFVSGSFFSYCANRSWTFGHTGRVLSSLWRFAFLYAITLGVNVAANSATLKLLDGYPQAVLASFIFATCLSATLNFLGMKFTVFGNNTKVEM
jgi:putative flippase GtrA